MTVCRISAANQHLLLSEWRSGREAAPTARERREEQKELQTRESLQEFQPVFILSLPPDLRTVHSKLG